MFALQTRVEGADQTSHASAGLTRVTPVLMTTSVITLVAVAAIAFCSFITGYFRHLYVRDAVLLRVFFGGFLLMKSAFSFVLLALALSPFSLTASAEIDRERFSFIYQDVSYTGEIMMPERTPLGVIIIVPGHGPTEFVEGTQFLGERRFFVEQGYSVAYWDKAGTGLSEGTYDHNQSIESSADESVAALAALDALDLENFENLGVWGISRAGWIVPKMLEQYSGIDFWVSVSGTTELNSSRYMLEANLIAEQRSAEEIDLLMSEWDDYQRILVRGGTLEEFNQKTANLMIDPYFNRNDFQMTEEILVNIQSYFQSGEMAFDEATNQAIMHPELETTLRRLSIPVLAILGRLDSQIDWRATGDLYLRAADQGQLPLSLVFLDTCNHTMQQSVTGGIYENLPEDTPACEGYYETMADWLNRLPE